MIELYNSTVGNIPVKFFTFPDGSRHVKIEPWKQEFGTGIYIKARLTSSNDIIDLLLLKSVLDREAYSFHTTLRITYMLGARQDRLMSGNMDVLSIKVYADIINSAGFDTVIVLDPHSAATAAALDNAKEADLANIFYDSLILPEKGVVISPDAGAVKRATLFAKSKGYKLVKADKTRNLETGEIIDFNLYATKEDIEGQDVYLVDDIVTNGGTFLGLLDVINEMKPASVNLVVTHADHEEGLIRMRDHFDNVYVTNSRADYNIEGVTVVKV